MFLRVTTRPYLRHMNCRQLTNRSRLSRLQPSHVDIIQQRPPTSTTAPANWGGLALVLVFEHEVLIVTAYSSISYQVPGIVFHHIYSNITTISSKFNTPSILFSTRRIIFYDRRQFEQTYVITHMSGAHTSPPRPPPLILTLL